jgi:ATP-dependent DNA ligase
MLTFNAVQTPSNQDPIRFPVVVQPKVDGWRLLITINPASGKATAVTRRGVDLTRRVGHILRTMVGIVQRAGLTAPITFDGELQASDGTLSSTIAILNGKASSRDRELCYHAFDLQIEGDYATRREALKALLWRCRNRRIVAVQDQVVSDLRTLRAIYSTALSDGLEGIVIKRLGDEYGGLWLRCRPGVESALHPRL